MSLLTLLNKAIRLISSARKSVCVSMQVFDKEIAMTERDNTITLAAFDGMIALRQQHDNAVTLPNYDKQVKL